MSLSWPTVFAPLLLSGMSLFAAPQPDVQLTAKPGQAAALRVQLSTTDLLLSREAPNRLTLSTPWGKAQAKPSGMPHSSREFSGYYGQVRPLSLAVKVPAQTKPGTYRAELTGELFVCDTGDKVCTLRPLKRPVRIQVGRAPARVTTLILKDADLRSARLTP